MLAILTLLVFLVVVLALVVYLVAIILALRGANRNLTQLAGGLEAIAKDTQPLPQKLTTINSALGQLLSNLISAEGHLGAVARLLSR
jgi:predicted PurR-regulated permease PerM